MASLQQSSLPIAFLTSILVLRLPQLVNSLSPCDDAPCVTLHNAARIGLGMPIVGLGTGHCNPVEGGECMNNQTAYKATLDFLNAGGRRIDTAISYHDQTGIGQAIQKSPLRREEVFITSKVGPGYPLGYQDTLSQMKIILEQLNTTYVDLLLIHWPGPPGDSVDPDCKGPNVNYTKCRLNTWRAMEEILKAGTAYAIGVSNYEENHLDEILNTPGLLRPSVNQVEFHPYWQERDLLQFCKSNNITFNGYAPYASNDWAAYFHHWPHSLLNDTTLQSIAKKHAFTPAQIALRWQYQLGIVVNPRSQTPSHMRDNVQIFDFELSDEEMQQIGSLQKPPVHPKVFPDPHSIP